MNLSNRSGLEIHSSKIDETFENVVNEDEENNFYHPGGDGYPSADGNNQVGIVHKDYWYTLTPIGFTKAKQTHKKQ